MRAFRFINTIINPLFYGGVVATLNVSVDKCVGMFIRRRR